MDKEDECDTDEEMQLLSAIYMDELSVDYCKESNLRVINITLHPATGEKIDEQLVCLTLEFLLPKKYPSVVPLVKFINPRGLSDEHVTSLRKDLSKLAEESCGCAMLYTLIEFVKESLSKTNVPYGQCVICLLDFTSEDQVTKTECYHYFHCNCLHRYIENNLQRIECDKKEALKNKVEFKDNDGVICPVCRLSIKYDLQYLKSFSEETAIEEKYEISKEMRQLQLWMKALFQKQLDNGGIIDLEAEKNKHLIVEGVTVETLRSNTEHSDIKNCDDDDILCQLEMKCSTLSFDSCPSTTVPNVEAHENLSLKSFSDEKPAIRHGNEQVHSDKNLHRKHNYSSKFKNDRKNCSNINLKSDSYHKNSHRGRARPRHDDHLKGRNFDHYRQSANNFPRENGYLQNEDTFSRREAYSSSGNFSNATNGEIAPREFKFSPSKRQYDQQQRHIYPRSEETNKSKYFFNISNSSSHRKSNYQKENDEFS